MYVHICAIVHTKSADTGPKSNRRNDGFEGCLAERVSAVAVSNRFKTKIGNENFFAF